MGWSELDSWRLAGVHGRAHPNNRKRSRGYRSCADSLPNRARGSCRSKTFHDRAGCLHFNVVLYAGSSRDDNAGGGSRPLSVSRLPFFREWNGYHRLGAPPACNPPLPDILSLEIPLAKALVEFSR